MLMAVGTFFLIEAALVAVAVTLMTRGDSHGHD